jgi:hypothetical protein
VLFFLFVVYLRGSQRRTGPNPECLKKPFPIPWPTSVAYKKRPIDWTLDDLNNLAHWLDLCGRTDHATYVSVSVVNELASRIQTRNAQVAGVKRARQEGAL